MDGYAPAYLAHNIPLLVVSGLGSQPKDCPAQGAIQLASEIPPVESDDAQVILRHFKDSDAGELAWSAREHSGRKGFKVKAVGRVSLSRQRRSRQSLKLDRIIRYLLEMLNFPSRCPIARFRKPYYILRSRP